MNEANPINRAVARDVTNHVTTGSGLQLAVSYYGSLRGYRLFHACRAYYGRPFYGVHKIIIITEGKTKILSEKPFCSSISKLDTLARAKCLVYDRASIFLEYR